MTTKQLNRRQARWAEYLSRFNFKIQYRPGRLGTKPNALTRRSGDLPSVGDPRIEYRNEVVLKPHQIACSDLEPLTETINTITRPDSNSPAFEEDEETPLDLAIAEAYENDEFATEILALIRNGSSQSKKITLAQCEERDGQL